MLIKTRSLSLRKFSTVGERKITTFTSLDFACFELMCCLLVQSFCNILNLCFYDLKKNDRLWKMLKREFQETAKSRQRKRRKIIQEVEHLRELERMGEEAQLARFAILTIPLLLCCIRLNFCNRKLL